ECGVGVSVGSWFSDACFGYFFFQAEDGIRDYKVTGVQTCALPVSALHAAKSSPSWPSVGSTVVPTNSVRAKGPRTGSAASDRNQIGRASCRERVQITVVAGFVKKKKSEKIAGKHIDRDENSEHACV